MVKEYVIYSHRVVFHLPGNNNKIRSLAGKWNCTSSSVMLSDKTQNKDENTRVFLVGRIKGKSKMGKNMDYQELSYKNMKYICTNLITGNYGVAETKEHRRAFGGQSLCVHNHTQLNLLFFILC